MAGLPQMVGQGVLARDNTGGLLLLVGMAALLVFFIVVFTEAQRRVPVQYGRSVFRGGRMYRQSGTTHLPLRVNSAGMIPLIFAFSIVILPGTIATYFASSGGVLGDIARTFVSLFTPTAALYWVLVFILVAIFTFFYTLVVFNQQQLADWAKSKFDIELDSVQLGEMF